MNSVISRASDSTCSAAGSASTNGRNRSMVQKLASAAENV